MRQVSEQEFLDTISSVRYYASEDGDAMILRLSDYDIDSHSFPVLGKIIYSEENHLRPPKQWFLSDYWTRYE